jgi:hypothetical protein
VQRIAGVPVVKAQPPEDRPRRLLMVAGVTVIFAGFFQAVWYVNHRPPPDLKDRFLDVAPFVELVEVGQAGWVGRVNGSWAGLNNSRIADTACATLRLRLKPTGRQRIILLDPEGLPAKECTSLGLVHP